MRSKIVATLGPASADYSIMQDMVVHGVRIFRLNFSHADPEFFVPTIKMIRDIENELDLPLTVMGDLCGPKIRIGEVKGSPLTIAKNTLVFLGLPEAAAKADPDLTYISLDVPEMLKGLEPGMPVSLSDGMLQFTVQESLKRDELYLLKAQNGGILTSHKGVAFPGKFHPMPALTEKDRKNLHDGLDVGLDAVALSFVQTQDDVLDLKSEIERHGTWIPVVSKLERKNALDNLDSILAATDAVMVARGDLGLECPLAGLPVMQKRIIRACRHAQKASIVATQLLLSMVNNPLPTRAETTDVANAIIDGADCVMLSEETAIGRYPAEAVRFINNIAQEAEIYLQERIQGPFAPRKESDPAKYLAYAATLLAENMDGRGIVSHTESGSTARLISSRRAAPLIYALTTNPRVVKALNFFYAVKPAMTDSSIQSHMARAEKFIAENPEFKDGDTLIITAGQPTPGQLAQMTGDAINRRPSTNQIKIYYK